MKTETRFIADRDTATIIVERGFAAPRRMVWDCYTKAELLDRWYAPEPLTARTASMDFREGGHWHFAMVMPDGQEFWSLVRYDTIRPIEFFAGRDAFSDAEGTINPDLPQARQEVGFSAAGDHCLVNTRIAYASAEDLDKVIAMGMEAGLKSTLERLDTLLETLNPREA